MKTPGFKSATSAGGVVYRWKDSDLQVVLCGRLSANTWSLPKGTPDFGESIEETALREVREETGFEVRIEQQLGQINYHFDVASENVRYYKTVFFFLMSVTGGSMDNHDPEFDTIRWFQVSEALDLLTYPSEASIARRAAALLE